MAITISEVKEEMTARNYYEEEPIEIELPQDVFPIPDDSDNVSLSAISPVKVLLIFGALTLLALFPGEKPEIQEVQNANNTI